METQTPPDASALQRILAYGAAALIGLGLLLIAVILVATAAGVGRDDGFESGVWPVVVNAPVVVLPLGFAFIIVLLAVSGSRRSKRTHR